jgi:hypothetical protein
MAGTAARPTDGGTDATAGDAAAAGDISDTGGSFSGGFGSG